MIPVIKENRLKKNTTHRTQVGMQRLLLCSMIQTSENEERLLADPINCLFLPCECRRLTNNRSCYEAKPQWLSYISLITANPCNHQRAWLFWEWPVMSRRVWWLEVNCFRFCDVWKLYFSTAHVMSHHRLTSFHCTGDRQHVPSANILINSWPRPDID